MNRFVLGAALLALAGCPADRPKPQVVRREHELRRGDELIRWELDGTDVSLKAESPEVLVLGDGLATLRYERDGGTWRIGVHDPNRVLCR